MMLKLVQVIVAFVIVALATIGVMWVLNLIDVAEAQASLQRVGGFLGICAVAAVALMVVFSVGGRSDDQG